MQVAGSASWRLSVGDAHLADLALFVRDAARLDVGAVEVPRLSGVLPDARDVLSADEHAQASADWPGWWQQILRLEFREPTSMHGPHDLRARIAASEAVADPPGFAALADRPALRTVARAVFDDFVRRPRPARTGAVPAWESAKQVAEDVAFDRGVELGAVRGHLVVLPVDGVWWRRFAPGAALCSDDAIRDPHTAQVVLREVFDSQIREG